VIEYQTIKPLLFRLDPEDAHALAVKAIKAAGYAPWLLSPWVDKKVCENPALSQELFGVKFRNPVGLGAGFDKEGEMIAGMAAMGFGYTEVGTVTPKPQPGNPRPRLWRHIEEEALQNAMGFNNAGAEAMFQNLQHARPYPVPFGVNVG
jgi:dihydroorotate dehydrogenase